MSDTATLPAYSGQMSQCPKCGTQNASTTWVATRCVHQTTGDAGTVAAYQDGPIGYPPEAVTVLRVIKAAQRVGFTLDEVADLLELGRHRHGKRVDAGLQRRGRAKLAEVEERIADLVAIRDNLTVAPDAGCDDLLACAGSVCCPIPFETITETTARPPGGGDR